MSALMRADLAGPFRRYACAILVVAIAASSRALLPGWTGPPYATFYPAILIAATAGGFGPCLVATALSIAIANGLLAPPAAGFIAEYRLYVVQTVFFLLVGSSMSAVAGFLHRREARAHHQSARALMESEER